VHHHASGCIILAHKPLIINISCITHITLFHLHHVFVMQMMQPPRLTPALSSRVPPSFSGGAREGF